MLSAPRRLLASSTIRCNLLAPSFVVGSSKDLERPTHPFSTSSIASEKSKSKSDKAKNLERYEKAKRKQALRAEKQRSEEAKNERERLRTLARRVELEEKHEISAELAEGVDPLSEEQLEAMYRGLLGAPPAELRDPALAAPSALLLGDKSAEQASGRQSRLAELEERFKALELSEEEERSPGALASRLSARLKLGKEVDKEVGDGLSTDIAPGEVSLPNKVLQILLRHAEDSSLGLRPSTHSGSDLEGSVPTGLIVESEWADLVLACAEEEDGVASVQTGLRLMKKTNSNPENVLSDVLALYASQGRTRDALTIAKFAREQSLEMSVASHHHLLTTLVPSHVEVALKHLHSLEAAGHVPLLDTYTLLIRTLLAPSSPPHMVSRGWDLYAHTRLVAHPVPDVALYSEMIQACSHGPHPSPERALDLFTEMTMDNNLPPSEQAYNGVIRACTREGSQERYFEGLRLMRQMLDTNVMPSRHTFHAVLEGARRHGDLARARWILVKMVGVRGQSAPDANTLALVFRTYALYQPTVKQSRTRQPLSSSAQSTAPSTPTSSSADIDPPSTVDVVPPRSETETAPTDIVQLLGEESLFYPGPLPQTADELVAEARNLMLQCVGSDALAPSSTESSTSSLPNSTIFPAVEPRPFLLNSYLAVLASHASFPVFVDFFRGVFTRLGVEKNRYTFETVMEKCETVKNREEGLKVAKETFVEWQRWSESSGAAELKGNNISCMWGSMIRVLARSFANEEALTLLKRFVSLYPPKELSSFAKEKASADTSLPALPSPLKLSSTLYPETQTTGEIDRRPHLLYKDLKLLHLRLANVDDERGIKTLTGILKAYEGELARSKEVEEKRPRMDKRRKAERARAKVDRVRGE